MRHRNRFTIALAVLVMTIGLTTGPALAAKESFRDVRGDAHPRVDLTKVTVKNSPERVSVLVKYAKLRKKDRFNHDVAVWIDTPSSRVPNYLLGVEGYHTFFGRTQKWQLAGGDEFPFGDVECSVGYRFQAKKDRVRFRFPASCIDDPAKIRVAVSAALRVYPSGVETFHSDHLVALHHLTGWVRR